MRQVIRTGMSHARIPVALLCIAALAACATQQEYPRLDRAHSEIQQAQSNPMVSQYAQGALSQAKDALGKAQASVNENKPEKTAYLAYIAERRAQIAVAKARHGQAEQRLSEAKARQQQQRQNRLSSAQQRAQSAEAQARAAQTRAAMQRRKAQQSQSKLRELKQKLADFNPRRTSAGVVLTLGGVLFRFNSADLQPSANGDLDKLAKYLKQHSGYTAEVNGYTDSVGSKSYNRKLSRQRAESVASALEQRGVDGQRLTTHGRGESNPVATNETKEGRTKNRRVEFVIEEPDNSRSQGGS